jgi:hypothetical protein
LKAAFGRLFFAMPLQSTRRSAGAALLCALAALLSACALPQTAQPDITHSPWAAQSGVHAGPTDQAWTHTTFPGKVATEFTYARLDGRDAASARADSSASMLRQQVHIAPEALGRMRFSWKVPQLIEQADLALRDSDDAPVRIVLAFDGDRSRYSARDAALSELARVLTGEELPYATLMYVWCNRREPGTVITSPRTERIRKLVVESGPHRLNQWLDYERDIRADFRRAFGEEPGALVGIAVMSDSDNTHTQARAWYGPLRLMPVRHAH